MYLSAVSGASAASIDGRLGVQIGPRHAGPASGTSGSPASVLGHARRRPAATPGGVQNDVVAATRRTSSFVELERVDRVEDRRVGVEEPGLDARDPVDPVLVDAGDQRPLVVEDRLALDDRGERQDLVEGQARGRSGRPSAPRRRSRRTCRASAGPARRASCRAARGRSPATGSPRARRPPARPGGSAGSHG